MHAKAMDRKQIETVLLEQKEELERALKEEYCTRSEEALINLNSKLAQVVIGIRRSGKSTMCFNIIKKYKQKISINMI